ncbi:MAG: hypothetical protein PUE68_03145 [Kiritimatiellae bacterium]|nr:hypothetical protein [Kiritimatiellia bacterium]
MANIRTRNQFREAIDSAFETQRTRDEAKACYDFQRDELKAAEEELCAFAAGHPEVFDGTDGKSGWGATEKVEFTISAGRAIERADGGRLTDAAFLDALPKRYVRFKREINKAKIKADGLDAEALAKLGLVQVDTSTLKMKPRGE